MKFDPPTAVGFENLAVVGGGHLPAQYEKFPGQVIFSRKPQSAAGLFLTLHSNGLKANKKSERLGIA